MNKVNKSKVPLFVVRLNDTLKLVFRFFFNRSKFTNTHEFEEPFFIIGSGRSGNTLLRSILVSSNEISIPPESYVWPRIIRKFSTYSFLPWDVLSSIVISEFESFKEFYTWEINIHSAYLKAKNLPKTQRTLSNVLNIVYSTYNDEKNIKVNRWGDKTPINTIYINKILKIFPKAQYIHILRDPRDVVCSYVKAGLYDNYEDAASFWKEATKKAEWLKRKLPKNQFYEIKYENLVQNPEHEIKEICKFLNITYSDKLLNFWKNTESLGDVKYGNHHKNVGNPISASSIGKWKEVLSNEDLDKINRIIKE